jgi:hypothetical protein
LSVFKKYTFWSKSDLSLALDRQETTAPVWDWCTIGY